MSPLFTPAVISAQLRYFGSPPCIFFPEPKLSIKNLKKFQEFILKCLCSAAVTDAKKEQVKVRKQNHTEIAPTLCFPRFQKDHETSSSRNPPSVTLLIPVPRGSLTTAAVNAEHSAVMKERTQRAIRNLSPCQKKNSWYWNGLCEKGDIKENIGVLLCSQGEKAGPGEGYAPTNVHL